jgi:fermentation-respiration switch protein FrsA (DUF1100 family)
MGSMFLCSNLPILILQIGLAVFVAVILLILIFSFVVFKKTFGRSKELASESNPIYEQYQDIMKEGESYFYALNPEEVSIVSHDNLTLYGLFYEHPSSRGTVIFMHGHHGNPCRDFGPVLKKFKDMGFSLLLPYQRAHGKSEGKYTTFGIKESKDCVAWAKFIAQKYPERSIALHGVSLGGATVGMASSMEDLPKEVKLIANDCGFTSPDAIVSSVRKTMKLPFFPFQLIVRLYARVFAKFSLTENSATKCYEKSTVPALFIHGEADDYVPYYMGLENYEKSNASDKIMISVKGAGHALAYILDPERVAKELTDFYNKHM